MQDLHENQTGCGNSLAGASGIASAEKNGWGRLK
jgi:hypothetical protein